MREQFRIVARILDGTGYPYRIEPGGKHPRFVVEAHGRTVTVPISFSPRDRHIAGINTVKQIVRALNAAKEVEKKNGKEGCL